MINYTYHNWGPFLYRTKLPDNILKKLLIEGKKTKASYNKKLAGHLNHQYLYPENVQHWFYKEITPYLNSYRDGHSKYHCLENLTIEMNYADLWINFMQAGDFNPLHTHGGDYSFVIFLQIPDKLKKEMNDFEGTSCKPGTLVFEYTQTSRPKWATTGTTILPEEGDFYIFPAMLQHWVVPFKSKVERISVSGNLEITNRSNLPKDYF